MTLPRLHVVTDEFVLERDGWTRVAGDVLEAGASDVALHVRGPRTSGRKIFELVEGLLPVARTVEAFLIVNDRVDVALAAAADGVHLGGRSIGTAAARAVVGTALLVGVSTHGAEGPAAARDDGADYAFVGTVFESGSHPGVEALGISVLIDATERASGFPVLGIGGITPERAQEVVAAGAHGVAVMRGIWNAKDPAEAVLGYLEAIRQGRDGR